MITVTLSNIEIGEKHLIRELVRQVYVKDLLLILASELQAVTKEYHPILERDSIRAARIAGDALERLVKEV